MLFVEFVVVVFHYGCFGLCRRLVFNESISIINEKCIKEQSQHIFAKENERRLTLRCKARRKCDATTFASKTRAQTYPRVLPSSSAHKSTFNTLPTLPNNFCTTLVNFSRFLTVVCGNPSTMTTHASSAGRSTGGNNFSKSALI